MELSTDEFGKIVEYVYEQAGIRYEENKLPYVSKRVKKRMEVLCITDADEYYRQLKFIDRSEVLKLVEELTVNETYFFRNFPQLQGFADKFLPLYLEGKRKKNDWTLNLWSAACSTGEEAYTLGIILKEVIDDFDRWKVSIIATDIDRSALHRARLASYKSRSIKDVPTLYREKYLASMNGEYRVLPDITGLVEFRQLNLMEKKEIRRFPKMDIIFCRNVLIYFDDLSRRRVLGGFYDVLRPRGGLFLGHSESVGRITAAFELMNLDGFLVYKKPEGGIR